MADNKNSFVLYTDLHHTVKKLSDEQSGKLFKHILSYVNDENPVLNDFVLEIAFEPIKQTLKRDLKKYEAICLRNKVNGSKGGRPKIKKPKKPIGLIGNPDNPDEPKKPDSDSGIDNDSGNGIEKKEIKIKYSDFVSMTESEHLKLVIEYGEKNVSTFIATLDNYKGSSGKKYKEDYRAILSWVVDDVKKKGKYEGRLAKPKFVF